MRKKLLGIALAVVLVVIYLILDDDYDWVFEDEPLRDEDWEHPHDW